MEYLNIPFGYINGSGMSAFFYLLSFIFALTQLIV